MGQATGGSGNIGMNLLKGGLTGLGQGLQNYSKPGTGFNFTQLQQGFQANRKPLGQKVTPNAAQNQNQFSQNPVWGGDPNINGGYYT